MVGWDDSSFCQWSITKESFKTWHAFQVQSMTEARAIGVPTGFLLRTDENEVGGTSKRRSGQTLLAPCSDRVVVVSLRMQKPAAITLLGLLHFLYGFSSVQMT